MKTSAHKKETNTFKSFPKVMKSTFCHKYVLFRKFGGGTVIHTSDNCMIGEYREDWNMDHFMDMDVTITIES